MDAVNENRVFNLLVRMTGRPGSSQYFLLTPKVSVIVNYNYNNYSILLMVTFINHIVLIAFIRFIIC